MNKFTVVLTLIGGMLALSLYTGVQVYKMSNNRYTSEDAERDDKHISEMLGDGFARIECRQIVFITAADKGTDDFAERLAACSRVRGNTK